MSPEANQKREADPGWTELSSTPGEVWKGRTLLEYLAGRFPYRSAGDWTQVLTQGLVAVNGVPGQADQRLSARDRVTTRVQLREPPVPTHFGVVHLDAELLVVDKPAHLPSHADGNFIRHTLIFLCKEWLAKEGGAPDLWLAHRLDRETSGLVILVRRRDLLKPVMDRFARGEVRKRYVAVVEGSMEREAGSLAGWIGRDPDSTVSIKRAVLPQGTAGAKPALTDYQVLQRSQDRTLIRLEPKTGRAHQIRVHLAGMGHPIVGDKLYGRSDREFLDFVESVKKGADAMALGRQLLHASRLEFDHPTTGKKLIFDSAPPKEFELA
jgi:RluA family pseudouridine synthase